MTRKLVESIIAEFSAERIQKYLATGKSQWPANAHGEVVQMDYPRTNGAKPVRVNRSANRKLVEITYCPQGVEWDPKTGKAVAIASVVQWAIPQGEVGPGNDYAQLADGSAKFMDLNQAVAHANTLLSTPINPTDKVYVSAPSKRRA